MRPFLLLCLCLCTCCLPLSAQITAGPDPNSGNNCIPSTITFSSNGQVNGRNSYIYYIGQDAYVIFWTGARWEFWLQYIIIMAWCDADTAEPPCSSVFPWQADLGCDFRTAPYIGGPGCSSAPLPIELLHFEAKTEGSRVLLRWATTYERDHAYFAIERSDDQLRWQRIGILPATGNSLTTRHYTFSDEALPPAPVLHYRLAWPEGPAGLEAYSPIRAVQPGSAPVFSLSPNPAHEQVRLLRCGPDAPTEARIAVYTAEGQCCLEKNWDSAQPDIALSHLPPGLYWVQVLLPDAAPQVLRLAVW